MRAEILKVGGDATVLDAQFIDGLADETVESQFRAARGAEYDESLREA